MFVQPRSVSATVNKGGLGMNVKIGRKEQAGKRRECLSERAREGGSGRHFGRHVLWCVHWLAALIFRCAANLHAQGMLELFLDFLLADRIFIMEIVIEFAELPKCCLLNSGLVFSVSPFLFLMFPPVFIAVHGPVFLHQHYGIFASFSFCFSLFWLLGSR